MNELFFTQYLTENEHYIVEDVIRQTANELNCEVKYYRKLKQGHVPGYRECKIIGQSVNLNELIEKLKLDFIDCSQNHYQTTLYYLRNKKKTLASHC